MPLVWLGRWHGHRTTIRVYGPDLMLAVCDAGRVAQAPRWMQRSGLEWFFRLGVEPRRLWKRYLIHNPMFVIRAFAQFAGWRRYPLD